MSAPPDAPRDMSAHNHQEPPHDQHSTVRHIPIFVEGRDEPVLNRGAEPASQPPQLDRDQYFADDGPAFHHPPNFTRAFGTPFNKGFRQGPQPFVQQKAYPQSAFTRGPSPPPRAPSPHRHDEYVKVPVQTDTPSRPQQKQQPKQPSPQPRDPTPPPPPRQQPSANDPITQILSIQTDVLNLMTEVENFTGTKKDKRYMFLDEMLTRNLIKLDNIETEGKENIRQARKEAIKCIQKCIAVLEAKADSNGAAAQSQQQDVEMKESSQSAAEPQLGAENGEVEMKETPKEDSQPARIDETQQPKEEIKEDVKREATPKPQEQTQNTETEAVPAAADTRPEDEKPEQKQEVENKSSPKKKVVKKRDKSKDAVKDSHTEDKSKEAPKDSNTEEPSKDSSKAEGAQTEEKVEVMQVDDKGDKAMEVDGSASQ